MQALHSLARGIDRTNDLIGRAVAWLTLAMVLIQFVVVVLRYVFGLGFIWMQESILYMHGIVFLVGAGYTLLKDGHVRVDIFYREARPTRKALVDLLGVIFLLVPFCALVWTVALPYVMNSWAVLEGSKETSGIQGVYLLKTSILVFTVLVGLQGLATALKSILVLSGVLDDNGDTTGAERGGAH
ncbi:TRAP dicarboxylate transporter [Caenispirillum salinarum AK4]|uniref:TRAP transporter small permease protein n=1 Tax=Caenispirillum salinarum AK4 TaxID=1238182 RepID=K9H245_9PROT|nr:TRAP transporter small permease subunit [Caenispirillum salinarum]EKV31617.1 TRAP dicarboxylate transporter [Caenispirillum salinarum AK4]